MRHERKNDELLSYIHHARDGEEHSLQTGAEPIYEITAAAAHQNVRVENGTIYIPQNLLIDTQIATLYTPGLRLVPITDTRYGQVFPVPTKHLGQSIEGRIPAVVAKIAFAYFERLVEKAEIFLIG